MSTPGTCRIASEYPNGMLRPQPIVDRVTTRSFGVCRICSSCASTSERGKMNAASMTATVITVMPVRSGERLTLRNTSRLSPT
jgi:hypothetical protein